MFFDLRITLTIRYNFQSLRFKGCPAASIIEKLNINQAIHPIASARSTTDTFEFDRVAFEWIDERGEERSSVYQ